MIRVELIRAWPRRFEAIWLTLPDNATVAQALAAGGVGFDGVAACAVFGVRAGSEDRLQDGDRLEILRPLQIDPKDARRRRALKP